jgi:CRISPR-associated protein Cas5h
MEAIYFNLRGKTAFFKKPDVNVSTYFTYNNIHKIAILGLLGAIIGLKGYNQQEKSNKAKANEYYPEFYERLQKIKISIIPGASKGYFNKKIHIFNNSVGYASKEEGGNLIIREQWLEDPSWRIFILDNHLIGSEIFEKLKNSILNKKCEYIPYLGKNDHFAEIAMPEVVEVKKNNKIDHINSLFPLEGVKFEDDNCFDGKLPFIFKEMSPVKLNKELNFYEYKELTFTNLKIRQITDTDNIYRYGDLNLFFI